MTKRSFGKEYEFGFIMYIKYIKGTGRTEDYQNQHSRIVDFAEGSSIGLACTYSDSFLNKK